MEGTNKYVIVTESPSLPAKMPYQVYAAIHATGLVDDVHTSQFIDEPDIYLSFYTEEDFYGDLVFQNAIRCYDEAVQEVDYDNYTEVVYNDHGIQVVKYEYHAQDAVIIDFHIHPIVSTNKYTIFIDGIQHFPNQARQAIMGTGLIDLNKAHMVDDPSLDSGFFTEEDYDNNNEFRIAMACWDDAKDEIDIYKDGEELYNDGSVGVWKYEYHAPDCIIIVLFVNLI